MKNWITISNNEWVADLLFGEKNAFPDFIRGVLYKKDQSLTQIPYSFSNLNELKNYGFYRPDYMAEIFEKLEEKKNENENQPS